MAAKTSLFSPRFAFAADALAEPDLSVTVGDLALSLPANANVPEADALEQGPVSEVRPSRTDAMRGEAARGEEVSEDVALVRAACARDSRAQRRIHQKYAPLVRAKLRASIGARDLDDMAQEVFLRLFQCLPALRDPSVLRSFIIGICLRVAGSELRRRGCHWWLCLLPADVPCDEPSGTYVYDAEGREALARLEAILASLSLHARRVFELRYIEKRGLAEVASTMGISLATAKRHLARAHTHVSAMVARDEALRAYACEDTAAPAALPDASVVEEAVAGETFAGEAVDAHVDAAPHAADASDRDDEPRLTPAREEGAPEEDAERYMPRTASPGEEGSTPKERATPAVASRSRAILLRRELRRARDRFIGLRHGRHGPVPLRTRAAPPSRATAAANAFALACSERARGAAHRLRAGPRGIVLFGVERMERMERMERDETDAQRGPYEPRASMLRARPFGEEPSVDTERGRHLGFDPKSVIDEFRHLSAA